jgi:hypothetical protein
MFEKGGRFMNTKRFLVAALRGSAVALLIAASAAPGAQPAAAGHGHGAGALTLKLDEGKKWETDAPLRQGMLSIRDAMAADHAAIGAGKESAAQYQALAKRLDEQVAYVVGNCKLKPEADANLHLVLADIIAGAEMMKGKNASQRRDGASKVIQALQTYPDYFNHPGWRAVD